MTGRSEGAEGGLVTAVRLRPRSAIAVGLVSAAGLVAFGWPLVVAPGAGLTQAGPASWLFVLLLPLLLVVALAEMSEGGVDAKAIALLGVLGAIGAALRPLGTGVAGFEPMFFVLVHGGRVLGRGFGYLLGSVTMFASALLTAGVGPWLPFQMLGAAWVGFGAGCLPRVRGRAEIAMLATYGAIAALVYGAMLNLSFWPFARYYPEQIAFDPHASVATNLEHWWRFDVTTSLGFDVPAAVGNVVLVLVLARPVLFALRRVARRAAFDAPVQTSAGDTVSATT
jgi:energy-coupling factor transport system substrate-specific component